MAFLGQIPILSDAIWGNRKLGARRGKPLTVLWDLFCSCRGQKARKTRLSKRCPWSHLFMPRSHVQPCLCNGRESAYQSLIPKPQEEKKISKQFAFSSRNPKLKKQSKLCSRCWCAHMARADLPRRVGRLLLTSVGLSVVNGGVNGGG